jgi:hypothetical protein
MLGADPGNGDLALLRLTVAAVTSVQDAFTRVEPLKDAANSTTALTANTTSIGRPEEFEMVSGIDGSVSLRSLSDNDWVTADNDGASPLIGTTAPPSGPGRSSTSSRTATAA